jgi:hypothetical protein
MLQQVAGAGWEQAVAVESSEDEGELGVAEDAASADAALRAAPAHSYSYIHTDPPQHDGAAATRQLADDEERVVAETAAAAAARVDASDGAAGSARDSAVATAGEHVAGAAGDKAAPIISQVDG